MVGQGVEMGNSWLVLMSGVYSLHFHHSIILMTDRPKPWRRNKLPNKSRPQDLKWVVLLDEGGGERDAK